MHPATCLLLLLIANGAPLAVWKLLGRRLDYPIDGGWVVADGRRLLGPSKTIRGVVAALVATALAAGALGVDITTGALIGLWAMVGDLTASFIKRRIGVAPTHMAFGLDQIPESLFPLLALRGQLALGWIDIAELVLIFLVLELLLSRLLFRIHWRKRPY